MFLFAKDLQKFHLLKLFRNLEIISLFDTF